MKLDIWSLLDAGGVFQYGRYEIRNSNGVLHREILTSLVNKI